jgi:hypothetical protein
MSNEGNGIPKVRLSLPFARLGKPFVGLGLPSVRLRKPSVELLEPFVGFMDPFIGCFLPFNGSFKSFVGVKNIEKRGKIPQKWVILTRLRGNLRQLAYMDRYCVPIRPLE